MKFLGEESSEAAATRFLEKFGRKLAWSSAKAIAESFDHIENTTAFWHEVADEIKRQLKESATEQETTNPFIDYREVDK